VTKSAICGNGTGVEMWAHRGGRFVYHSYLTARNCIIAGNLRDGIWGGISTLENCTVADNGGYALASVRSDISNSIVYFNNSGGDNLSLESSATTIRYSDIEGGWPGAGNLDVDPLFAVRGYWAVPGPRKPVPVASYERGAFWVSGDYHLKSQGWFWHVLLGDWTFDNVTSLCIDAGDPGLPLGDEHPCAAGDALSDRAAPNTRINMGAYGGTVEASLAPHGWSP
jgi:hypothetical protein